MCDQTSTQKWRASAPAVHPVPQLTLPQAREILTDSGHRLLIYNRSDAEVTQLRAIRAGGAAEAPTAATAMLLSPMLREGAEDISPAAMEELLELCGATLNTAVHPHHNSLTLSTLTSHWDEVLPTFVNQVLRPTFESERLSIHAAAAASNIEVQMEKVSYLAGTRGRSAAMGAANPLARVAKPEELRAITRKTLTDMHRRYDRMPMTLILAGKVTDIMVRTLTDLLRDSPASEPYTPELCQLCPEPAGLIESIHRPGSSQSAVMMTIPAINRDHADYLPLHIAVGALGGYFGSRLMLNLREDKGYTYGVSASLTGYPDGSFVSIASECDNRYTAALIDETRRELTRLASDPPRGEELMRLRQAMSSSLLETLESPLSVADFYATMTVAGIPAGYFDAKAKLLTHLTPEIIADVAARYLSPDRLRVTVAGDTAVSGII